MSEQKNADEIIQKLRYLADSSRSKHDVLIASADLHEQQQARIAELEAQLAESQRREQAAVEDIEKMMRICEKGSCHFCANGDCTESPYCKPKWRGPQSAKGDNNGAE